MQVLNDAMDGDFRLHYRRPLVIVGGGRTEPELLTRCENQGWAFVAADGGADNCKAAGIIPDAIIGDMDSVTDLKGWQARTRVIPVPEQETTDFEKCLNATQAPVWIGVGMTGGHIDHTLAALDASARHAARAPVIFVDERDLVLATTGAFSFALSAGERISVHPLTEIHFKLSGGLDYPLDGVTLAPGVKTGTSNSAATGPVRIEPADQSIPWLVILDRRHLESVVAQVAGSIPT